jgi:hypothetical protein
VIRRVDIRVANYRNQRKEQDFIPTVIRYNRPVLKAASNGIPTASLELDSSHPLFPPNTEPHLVVDG